MTIQNEERNVENGEAVKAEEPTALWSRMTDQGGIEEGRPQAEGTNPLVFIIGGVVMIGLIVLCFRLAFNGASSRSANRVFSNRGYLTDADNNYRGPAGPIRIGGPAASNPPTFGQPQSAMRPAIPASQPALLPAPIIIPSPAPTSTTWSSAMERDRVAGLLADCRVAYTMSGDMSQRWMSAVSNAKLVNTVTASSTAPVGAAAPQPLTNEDWNIIDGQIDAIAGTIGLAAQPSRYPEALQDTSMEFGREMRTYLQTTRAALSETDPQVRTEMQTRANSHRSKAGELLSLLEASLKEKVATAPPY